MTARGPNCPGQYIGIDPYNLNIELSDDDLTTKYKHVIHPIGGVCSSSGIGIGINGACGAGGYSTTSNSGNISRLRIGGKGTSFSGGAGAGGNAWRSGDYWYYDYKYTSNGADNGGKGGSAGYYSSSCYGGGGAGNPGGWGYTVAATGQDGTGGLIILIVFGNINITGNIQSNGSKGGGCYPTGSSGNYLARGGAGSGGGAIHIFYKNENIGSNKITVSGGSGGDGYYKGLNGGKGTINLVKI